MVSAYIKAGYMPHAGCNLQAATEWVEFHIHLLDENATVTYNTDECRFYMDISGMHIPTEWYWENNHLLKAIDTHQ